MPSVRRVRFFGVVVFAVVVYLLYLTNTARHTSRSPDFYSKTKDALDRDKGSYHPHGSRKDTGKDDEDEALAVAMSGRLKEAEQMAKDKANAKAPNPPEGFAPLDEKAKPVVEDIEPGKPTNDRNVAGRRKHSIDEPKEKPLYLDNNLVGKEVKEELNTIFKRAPIIIFSKSYCPHSKRAKHILLEKYNIVPAPYVVELDIHPKGAALQLELAEMTGRKTVPNVMINGKSIGGGDDTAALDDSGTLIEKIKSLGGKQMQLVEKKGGS